MVIQISRIQHGSLIKYGKKEIITKYISYFENKLKFEGGEINLTMEDEVFIDGELHIKNKNFYRKSRAKKYMKEYYKKALINK